MLSMSLHQTTGSDTKKHFDYNGVSEVYEMNVLQRKDGRSPKELRQVHISSGYLVWPLGSVLIEMGRTKVICSVSLDDTVPRFLRGKGTGWLTAEYAMMPNATAQRTTRESTLGRLKGRTQEIQRLIGRSLRSIIDLTALEEYTLRVDCDVIQADGGTRTASITGAYIALGEAIRKMRKEHLLYVDPIIDAVAAVSVGIVHGTPYLDLCYEEDAAADVDMNVVMTGSGEFVEIQGTAEERPFSQEQMNRMIVLAKEGIAELIEIQKAALEEQ